MNLWRPRLLSAFAQARYAYLAGILRARHILLQLHTPYDFCWGLDVMMKRLSRLFAFSALLSIFLWGALARAQTPEIPPRIAGPIVEQSRVRLRGNVPPMVQPQYDRGEAPGVDVRSRTCGSC